ncbi:hypothetical protein HV782_013835 [Pseudomonas monsensis]|uniref:hypothetical protein n=1 Tax=Pseudomonas monsensis TaxID=2745509 RepID=UPI0016487CF1|nr:hypothetical protein [Pseudomonas monsensis]QXI03003.1 hypothetical protein HV782_013835 [Pseudomonas monsensis]
MDFETAEIDVDQGSDTQIRLSAVPFIFNPGERSLYVGADGPGGTVQDTAWLGLKTEPFNGWYSAQILSVTGNKGTDCMFEVKRNFHTPIQEGEWLWFPVKRQTIEPYRD